jgi:hypothetical protein
MRVGPPDVNSVKNNRTEDVFEKRRPEVGVFTDNGKAKTINHSVLTSLRQVLHASAYRNSYYEGEDHEEGRYALAGPEGYITHGRLAPGGSSASSVLDGSDAFLLHSGKMLDQLFRIFPEPSSPGDTAKEETEAQLEERAKHDAQTDFDRLKSMRVFLQAFLERLHAQRDQLHARAKDRQVVLGECKSIENSGKTDSQCGTELHAKCHAGRVTGCESGGAL